MTAVVVFVVIIAISLGAFEYESRPLSIRKCIKKRKKLKIVTNIKSAN